MRRRSNSFDKKSPNKPGGDQNDNLLESLISNFNRTEIYSTKNKNTLLNLKKLQNISLTTYDCIFLGRQFNTEVTQDFSSFLEILEKIQQKYKKNIMNTANISNIKEEGKFSLNVDNITKIIPFNEKSLKNFKISINSKYIKTSELKRKNNFVHLNKCLFQGKHCYEIQNFNLMEPIFGFGLINIDKINIFKNQYINTGIINENKIPYELIGSYNFFEIKQPLLINENNNIFHHYISYGDILGICYDLNKKLLLIYLNGEIINSCILDIETGQNMAYIPFLSIGSNTELVFNFGGNLTYKENYKSMGFIPLDEDGKNNYELSGLKNVTNEYINILINQGKCIINNKNITYSDINQIYHKAFHFLGKISFQHSYLILNCFINPIINMISSSNNEKNEELFELCYLCIKYMLNSLEEPKTVIKSIFLTISESIHINLLQSQKIFKKYLNLLSYLVQKKDLIKILPNKIFDKIFEEILISFCPMEELFQKINLEFIIKSENNKDNNKDNINNNIIENIFKDIVTSHQEIQNNIFNAQNEYKNNKIKETYKEFIEMILNNGKESYDNILYMKFKEYIKKEIKKIIKMHYCSSERKFNNLLKTYFISGMHIFNQEYEKIQPDNNLISLSLGHLLTKHEEKLGGTTKYLYETYVKEIPNFVKISNMKINSIGNLFFLDFFDIFFGNNGKYFWEMLNNMNIKDEYFTKEVFNNLIKKESSKRIFSEFTKLIEYQVFYPNLIEIQILVKFLKNISIFMLNELYPKKIIYFLSEDIFIKMKYIIFFLQIIKATMLKKEKNLIENNKNILDTNSLILLSEETLKNYITILVKIISDKNIKKTIIKCDILSLLKEIIICEQNFTDEQIFDIFNFVNDIHNDIEYKSYAYSFLNIFENKIFEGERFTLLGKRLKNLFKKNVNNQNNNNLFRIALILIYNNINICLSKLEEIFAEYKFKQKINNSINNSNNNSINNNIANVNNSLNDNQNINDNNNVNNNVNIINNDDDNNNNNRFNDLILGIGVQIVNRMFIGNNQNRLRNPIIIFGGGINPRRNINQLTDKEKLELLDEALKDINNQFIKLINFYRLSLDIIELYIANTFENKFLNNLLLSLYNIVFSSANSGKISDNKVKNSYKKLLDTILKFFVVLIKNISQLSNSETRDKILKEMSKRRNLLHLKEIKEVFEKFDENKNKKIKNIEVNTKQIRKDLFNKFISDLEKLIPENETLKEININRNSLNFSENSALKDKNICTICADSVIDTHILPCGHSICRNCLFQCLSANKVCPFCRVDIKGIQEDSNFKI